MEKLMRTARIIDIVLTVIFWIMILSFVITTAAGYTVVANWDRVDTSLMKVGDVTAFPSDMTQGEAVRAWAINSVLYGAMVAAICVGIVMLRRIVKPMREGKPFDGTVSARLRWLGWYSLIVGAISDLFELFGQNIILRLLMLESGTVSVEHSVNLRMYIISGLFFLFSYIFRYGEELQKLSDETL